MRTMAAVLTGVLFGAAGLAGGRVMAAFQDEPKPAAQACVAVVNVSRVFEKYPKAKNVVEALQKEAEDLKSNLTGRENDLNKEAQDVEARFTAGTAEYEKAQRSLALRKAEIDWDKRAGLALLARKQVTRMAAVYEEIRAESERIAAANGFACVLNHDPEPIQVEDKGQVMGSNELKLQMALRPVIWARRDLDLTPEVIDALGK